jgi:hypothetical protein
MKKVLMILVAFGILGVGFFFGRFSILCPEDLSFALEGCDRVLFDLEPELRRCENELKHTREASKIFFRR